MRTLWIMLMLFAPLSTLAAPPDYTREKKWADEITPGIVVGDPVTLSLKNGHKFLGIYTDAATAKAGVVVVHGMGIHPDWGLIGTLRQQLPDHGYATLSVQMPVLAADAKPDDYMPHFPEAIERLKQAVDYLRGKGHKRIAVVSHSLGSRMVHAFLSQGASGTSAWAALGMPPARGAPVTYERVTVPVLDLYGADDEPQVLAGAAARKKSLGVAGSAQVVVTGANHFFNDQEDAMVKAVVGFLDRSK